MDQNYDQTPEFFENVVQINRITKKTKGGNQIRFAALVVVGDKNGKVGAGISKAQDVRSAIQKAVLYAKRRMIVVPMKGSTIPFEMYQKYGSAKVLLKPAPAGSGIIAGGPMRIVLDAAGVHDVVGKIMGTKNKINNVYATIEALEAISKLNAKREAK